MQNNKFKQLYEHCQTLSPKVKRNQIIDKAVELSGQPVRVVLTSLDTNVLRGFFISASNTEHPLVRENGRNVVVLAKGLNECWDRFINVKEVMHLLDSADEVADSAEKFESLLNEWASPALDSPDTVAVSDAIGIWKALACFCPEANRLEFETLLAKGQIDHYGIALRLKIPKLYVPTLFRPEFKGIVEMLIQR